MVKHPYEPPGSWIASIVTCCRYYYRGNWNDSGRSKTVTAYKVTWHSDNGRLVVLIYATDMVAATRRYHDLYPQLARYIGRTSMEAIN
jgi:hypothetical protein